MGSDRPTLLCICIHGTTAYTRTPLIQAAAPIVKGRSVIEVTFTNMNGEKFNYAVSNLKGAAKCVEGVLRYRESVGSRAELYSVNDEGNPSCRLTEWDFTSVNNQAKYAFDSIRRRDAAAEGHGCLADIVASLFTLAAVKMLISHPNTHR